MRLPPEMEAGTRRSRAINWNLAGRANALRFYSVPSAPAAARNEARHTSVLNDKAKRVEKSQSLRARFRGAKHPPTLRRKTKKIASNEVFSVVLCGASGGALSCRRTRKYPKTSAQGEALRACSRNQSHPPPKNPLPARTAVRKRKVLVFTFRKLRVIPCHLGLSQASGEMT